MADVQIIWFRQDLRLTDQAAVRAAAAAGPVLAVFVLDEESVRPMGGASRWWLHHSLRRLNDALGGRLLLLRGRSDKILNGLMESSCAAAIHALHQPEPGWDGVERRIPRLRLHHGSSLIPPGLLQTQAGTGFRVFTPYWRAHCAFGAPPLPLPAPALHHFAPLPAGDALESWGLLPTRPDWAGGFADWQPGEAGAASLLGDFLPRLGDYPTARDYPSVSGTSRLSPHLHFGEISPATLWHAAQPHGGDWTRQLVWRDFAHECIRIFPDSATRPHRPAFDAMPWTDVAQAAGMALLTAWQRGRTGYPLVDAGMRQLSASGWMHNRVRMVAASFLSKHLMIDWREGERWFWDRLVDADLANNAMGWQWVMGSGVDSAPWYRIFAPLTQSRKFDAAAYVRRWVPELADLPDSAIHGPFPAGHRGYPSPVVDHAAARQRALAAYAAISGA